jgi:hypothetical protein
MVSGASAVCLPRTSATRYVPGVAGFPRPAACVTTIFATPLVIE